MAIKNKYTGNELKEKAANAIDFVNIYKSGYMDGYSKAIGRRASWKKLFKDCAKAFKRRVKNKGK